MPLVWGGIPRSPDSKEPVDLLIHSVASASGIGVCHLLLLLNPNFLTRPLKQSLSSSGRFQPRFICAKGKEGRALPTCSHAASRKYCDSLVKTAHYCF